MIPCTVHDNLVQCVIPWHSALYPDTVLQIMIATWHACAGPDPLQAMSLINRLRLFPAVFTPTTDVTSQLPQDWGQQCVHTMEAAIATLQSVSFQASRHSPMCQIKRLRFLSTVSSWCSDIRSPCQRMVGVLHRHTKQSSTSPTAFAAKPCEDHPGLGQQGRCFQVRL